MTVYLVGAGPGDPGLMTVRGATLLRSADVIVHDRLADPSLLVLAPPQAERIDVGKRPGAPVDQDQINSILIDRARKGLEVVRLKGGDPFVFGRGGEEAQALQDVGIDYEVVPGITSAVAAPAYAGVPLTHRGLSASFSVVTGHSRQSVDQEVNWETLAKLGGTIVVLMGVAHRDEIAERLMAGGLDPATPVLAVVWGTRPDQSSVRTTLAGLSKVALAPPATIVIGRVAGLALSWYERKPLLGWRVVVTRAREQASSLADLLRNAGAEPVEFPVIEVRDAADGGLAMAEAADRLQTYDWVVFTSANAVDRFMRHVPDARAFGRTRIAVVGPGTASVLAAHKLVADLVPERFVAEGLLEAFPPPDGGKRVLMPRASKAREVLPTGLRSRGWEVHDVEAYRTEPARPSADLMISLARADAITFTSASTVAGFVAAARPKTLPPVVVCIGPLTAKAAGDYGLKVDAVAKEHTIDGVVAALAGVASGMSPSRGTSADP